MSDKTMEDIKSGKGLPPLSSNSDSSGQSGVAMEQRAEKGIIYEILDLSNDIDKLKYKMDYIKRSIGL